MSSRSESALLVKNKRARIQGAISFSLVSVLPTRTPSSFRLIVLDFMDDDELREFEMDRWFAEQMGKESP